jgi:hypothetical protein
MAYVKMAKMKGGNENLGEVINVAQRNHSAASIGESIGSASALAVSAKSESQYESNRGNESCGWQYLIAESERKYVSRQWQSAKAIMAAWLKISGNGERKSAMAKSGNIEKRSVENIGEEISIKLESWRRRRKMASGVMAINGGGEWLMAKPKYR